MEAAEQVRKFEEFFSKYEKEALQKKLIPLDFSELKGFDPDLANLLLEDPNNTIKSAEVALKSNKHIVRSNIQLTNLPKECSVELGSIRSKHYDKLVSIKGLTRNVKLVRKVIESLFECPSCGNIIKITQSKKEYKEPTGCGCGRKGNFILLKDHTADCFEFSLVDNDKMNKLNVELNEIEESERDKIKENQKKEVYGILKYDLRKKKKIITTEMENTLTINNIFDA